MKIVESFISQYVTSGFFGTVESRQAVSAYLDAYPSRVRASGKKGPDQLIMYGPFRAWESAGFARTRHVDQGNATSESLEAGDPR